MIDFDLYLPTKVYFGKDKEKLIGQILKEKNAHKVIIVIGQNSVKKSGLLDVVINELNNYSIEYEIIEGVRPNPDACLARKGVELAKQYHPDYLLAIGGGSVIDTAKSIAVGYYYDGDTFDFNRHKVVPSKALPIGVILTISASGSEMSNSCVIQDDEINVKAGFNNDIVRPIFAIENPELTYSVNKTQTAYGIVDILMHTLERYFQKSDDNEPADFLAEGLLKNVIQAGYKVMENPRDYQARADLMIMSSMSHNGITSIGKKAGLTVHQLEHAVSGVYPFVAHAAGLSVLFPAWGNYYIRYDVDKFDKLAKNVFDLHNSDKIVNAHDGIKKLYDFFTELGMPHTFKDLGIDNPDIDLLVKKVTNDGTRIVDHHIKPLDQRVIKDIFELCR